MAEKPEAAGADGAIGEPVFRPSADFVKYLTLVQACQAAAGEREFALANAEREKVTQKIARRRARSLNEVFEKLYIWRMEIFDPGEAGQVCYDDIFALSAYLDLKKIVKFSGASQAADAFYERHLKSPAKNSPAEPRQTAEDDGLMFASGASVKIH